MTMKCELCDYQNDNLKRFSDHVRSSHGMNSEQYTVQIYHGGLKPTCKICNAPVRYVSYSFKTYCKEHAKVAMKEGGAVGGKSEAWNKGKTKETDTRLAVYSVRVSGSGNHFFGRKHSQETRQKISLNKLLLHTSIEERIIERQQEFKLLTPIEEYKSRQRQYLQFQCIACGEVQQKTLQAFERGSRCYKCFPVGKSNWELDVFNYIRSLSPDAISGDKSVLSPKEIDIYVPSKKFGIECHGLYWHSEGAKPEEIYDKNKHLLKTELALSKGVRLLQLFEDEWRDKREICEGMIKHRLGLHLERCKTWSTKIVEMNTEEQREFFDSTHISGYTPSKVCWGLEDRTGRIVAALSCRTPRQTAKYPSTLEIARFSVRIGMSVPGGLSKLMKHAINWSKIASYEKIMTYVDRRIGDGKGYQATGFQLIGATGVDYWYTDNELRYDRFKFRANEGKSEREVALEARVFKIWGCGSQVMVYNLVNESPSPSRAS